MWKHGRGKKGEANLCIYESVQLELVLGDGAADTREQGGQVFMHWLTDISLTSLQAFDLYINMLNPMTA